MTARKRKAPDRRKAPVKQPGLLVQALTAISRALTRHPRRVAGLLSVCVASSFVAANALWYQPEGHPAPFFRTRDATDPNGIAGYRPLSRPHDSASSAQRMRICARSSAQKRRLRQNSLPPLRPLKLPRHRHPLRKHPPLSLSRSPCRLPQPSTPPSRRHLPRMHR